MIRGTQAGEGNAIQMDMKRLFVVCGFLAGLAHAESLTLPLDQRPDWLERDGIIMAGSWEPLPFRVRRDGSDGLIPTADQRAAYEREHSPEMVAQLKALGVNFVMAHCYKAFGREAERESMADAVRFSKLCHDAGLRVGVYTNSGTMGWETFFKEIPAAKDWTVLDRQGLPLTYGRAKYRYYWNRNHPDAQAFYRQVLRFAVEEIKTDLVHLDNYSVGPGCEPVSIERFRGFLRERLSPSQLGQLDLRDTETLTAATAGPVNNLLRRAWLDFSCQSLADSYWAMSRYARTLRPDILMECNPGGVREGIRPPIDHGRLLQGGEAFWDEGAAPGFSDGKLQSRIRTYKVARLMNNVAFTYCRKPLELAETMAFNRDCLGCICWFEYGKLSVEPGSKDAASRDLEASVRFFKARRDLLRRATVIADVAVLRSFASQVFSESKNTARTAAVEQALIENRVPFQIVYDQYLSDLKRYRALVLAGCVALSDAQIEQIRRYANEGGTVCVIGPVATHDEWMIPRAKDVFGEIQAANVVRISEKDDPVAAIRRACEGGFSCSVEAPKGLCAEFTEQPGRRLVHLVNYRSDGPVKDVAVRLRLPPGTSLQSVTLAGPERKDDIALTSKEADGVATFTVPAVNVYEIAVVTLKKSGS